MPKPAAPKYRTTNWPEHNAALKLRGSLEIWFDPQIHWLSKPCGRLGRPTRFSDSAIELCLTLKSLFNLPLRQVTGLVASLIKLAGLDWPVPDYTTLCQWQKTLKVELGGRPSSGGLCLLVESTGIKMTGEGEWKTRKQDASYRRQLRIPGSSRSAFRDNRDQRSEIMSISIPTSSRSVFRHDGDQMRDVLVV